jgi:signal transduction histidine kinase
MTQLLNDVILIGTAEAGQLKFNPTQLDLESLCREVVEELPLSLDSQQEDHRSTLPTIAFSTQGDDTQANLDEKLLRQILANLLSNAVKYSPKGGMVRFDIVCQEGQAIFASRMKASVFLQKIRSDCLNPSIEPAMLAPSRERDWG